MEAARKPSKTLIATLVLLLILDTALAWASATGSGLLGYELLGYVLAPVMFVGLAVAVALIFPKGRTVAAMARVASWVLGLSLLGTIAGLLGQGAALEVTDAERDGLVVDADSIRHRGFGFALPSPGTDFQPNATLQQRMEEKVGQHPKSAVWMLVKAGTGVVIVTVMKVRHLDATRFDGLAREFRSGLTKRGTVRVVQDSAAWGASGGAYHAVLQAPDGSWLRVRCLTRAEHDPPLFVCVETTTAESDTQDKLAAVREGLVLRRGDP